MGNTASSKSTHRHMHGEVECSRKHGHTKRHHGHKRSRRHSRRGRQSKHRQFKYGGIGPSPLNPKPEPSFAESSSTRKKRNVEKSLLRAVLKNETRKSGYKKPRSGSKSKTPIKRNFVVHEEVVVIEPASRGRRKSLWSIIKSIWIFIIE